MSEEEPALKKQKTEDASLPLCPYGSSCYRKNPQHFKEYSHSGSVKLPESSPTTMAVSRTTDLPPCEFGAKCYRKNLLHFAEFSHPVTGSVDSASAKDDTSDTDECDSDNDEIPNTSTLKKDLSMVKKYSQMTEDERRDLIKRAFEAKKELEKELQETKEKMKAKEKELGLLQQQVSSGLLLVEGEQDALDGDEIKYFPLTAERDFKEGSAAQTHFRLAESQFYRLLSGSYYGSHRVTKVEYVVNPKLVKGFRAARDNLKKVRGDDLSNPVLAFHGTSQHNITPICELGFKVPGDEGFVQKTDTGYYGKGVYFSEYPGYSMGYIAGCKKILLCQVLTGKVYKCTKLIHGEALKGGYDSHTSPDGKELVIFNSYHILPQYIVHFEQSKAEFTYKKPKDRNLVAGGVEKLKKLYESATKITPTKIFSGLVFKFFGKLRDKPKILGALVEKHGGKYITSSRTDNLTTATIIVSTEEEYSKTSGKVYKVANNGLGISVVSEHFIYESITRKEKLEAENYTFD